MESLASKTLSGPLDYGQAAAAEVADVMAMKTARIVLVAVTPVMETDQAGRAPRTHQGIRPAEVVWAEREGRKEVWDARREAGLRHGSLGVAVTRDSRPLRHSLTLTV